MMAGFLASFTCSILLIWMTVGNGVLPVSCTHANSGEQLTAKETLIRYWDLKIPNSQKPSFLVDKASPLTAAASATFRRYAEQHALQSHLRPFCESAHLFCFPQPSWQLHEEYYAHHHNHQQQQADGKATTAPPRFKPYRYRPERETEQPDTDPSAVADEKNIYVPLKVKPYRDPPPTERPDAVPAAVADEKNTYVPLRFKPYEDPPPSKQPDTDPTAAVDEKNTYVPLRFKPYGDPPPSKWPDTNPSAVADGKSISGTRKFKPYRPLPSKGVGNDAMNKWIPEPGKFFREKVLKPGSVVPMPDIRDFMPERSFLPRPISRNLPFSSSELKELQRLFQVSRGSGMEKAMRKTLLECEMEPSKGETKRCVTSIEDMIDFVVSVLGKHVEVKATNSTRGWGEDVQIGSIKGIDGGRITTAVTCHQSMFPYLVYYCHAVPTVRAYEATLLDAMTKKPINQAMAMCHHDTSVWKESHAAFKMALGAEPGEVELCHWVFENDILWVPVG